MIYLWYSHIIGPHISDVVPHSSYFMIMWNWNGVWKYSTQNETWFASSLSPSFRGQGSQVYPQHSSCGLNAELFRCMVLALEYGKNCKHKVSNGFKWIIWSHVLFSLRFRVYINKLSCCDHSRVGGYHQSQNKIREHFNGNPDSIVARHNIGFLSICPFRCVGEMDNCCSQHVKTHMFFVVAPMVWQIYQKSYSWFVHVFGGLSSTGSHLLDLFRPTFAVLILCWGLPSGKHSHSHWRWP